MVVITPHTHARSHTHTHCGVFCGALLKLTKFYKRGESRAGLEMLESTKKRERDETSLKKGRIFQVKPFIRKEMEHGTRMLSEGRQK